MSEELSHRSDPGRLVLDDLVLADRVRADISSLYPEYVMGRVDVIVTTFNKAESIQRCIERLITTLEASGREFRIIVADDASTDETVTRIRAIDDPRIDILTSTHNQGKGAQVKRASRLTDADIIAMFDGDLDIHPKSLASALCVIESSGVDVVVASKSHPDSEVQYPIGRRFLSQVFKLICKSLFNLAVRDTQTGLKVFKGDLMRTFAPHVRDDGYLFDLELLVMLSRQGFAITEVPVTIAFDFTSTVSFSAIIVMVRDLVRIWRSIS